MRSLLLLTTAAALVGATARAEDDASGLITVTAPRDQGYRVKNSGSATRTDTPLLDVPQTVDVLSRDRLDDQAILSISDALRYVPGTTAAQGEGNRDQIVIRGNNSSADFFVDGMRDDVQYFRDFYNTERLEILKGPSALIFGRGGAGGVVNRVSKTPHAGAFLTGDVAADTFGGWRIGADAGTSVGRGVTARLTGFYEDGANHRQFFDVQRWGINPTLGFGLGDRGDLIIGYEHVDDNRLADRGVPSENGHPLPDRKFRDTFFGARDVNRSMFNGDVISLAGDYALTDNLSLRHRSRYGDYDKLYRNLFPVTAVAGAAGGDDDDDEGPTLPGQTTNETIGVEAYLDTTRRKNFLSQTDLVWKVGTGALDHIVLTGVEIGRQTTRSTRINGFFNGDNTLRVSVPLTDPFVPPPLVFRAGPGQRDNDTRADFFAVFVQDQVSIGAHFDIVAGLRYDRFTLDYTNNLDRSQLSRSDNLWSPRLGLIYKPIETASLYFSYSKSYLPQSGDQFTSLNATTASLKPESFENFEIGGKWDVTPALNLTTAIYRLDRTNTRANDPVTGGVVLSGASRSEGWEVALNGRLLPNWQATAGFALQDARLTSSTTAGPAGRKVPLVPRTQASLWTRYDVVPGFGAGFGVIHNDSSFTTISNAVVLPAYTRVDAALFARLGKNLDAQINLENLFNTGYFPTAHTDNNISTGGPRSARLTLRTRF